MTNIIHSDPLCSPSHLISILGSEGRHRLTCWPWFTVTWSRGLVELVALVASFAVELFMELPSRQGGSLDQTIDFIVVDQLA